jgi:hypothetical protein
MLDEDFIGKIFPQNCGDSLLVVEKSNKKDNGGNYLYRCQFQKYFYEVFVCKTRNSKRHSLYKFILIKKT